MAKGNPLTLPRLKLDIKYGAGIVTEVPQVEIPSHGWVNATPCFLVGNSNESAIALRLDNGTKVDETHPLPVDFVNMSGNVTVNVATGDFSAWGLPTDAAVVNPAADAGVVALTKGLLTQALVLGAKADAEIVDPTAAGSIVALTKGLLATLLTNTGVIADAAVVDPTADAGLIALTKGVLQTVLAAAADLAPKSSAVVLTTSNLDADDVAAGRELLINATVAGNVKIKLKDGSNYTLPVLVGLTSLDIAAVRIFTTGTTATATYTNLN